MFKAFLIKYAEIGIKGKNRYLFEDALVSQIRFSLKKVDGEFKVYRTQGRIYVDALSDFDYDETVENLKTVFGVSGICVALAGNPSTDNAAATIVTHLSDVGTMRYEMGYASAIATVGSSCAGSANLGILSKYLIILYMYFGRVGVLTLSLGFLMGNKAKDRFQYADTNLLIG